MGEQKIGKEIVEAIDEEQKSITLKIIEGHLLDHFKTLKIGIHVDTKAEPHLVTWVLEYEKLHDEVEDPVSFLALLIKLGKDIETYHLKN
ncbi:UNVERIFIED_CONTAM: Kirola [Sesamum angustifolium]|uniref:Kirola n=1 Tax=Sesamum angustifolium TaxID=2727405 RepID=A0AAW2PRL3_9LAMI